MKAILLAAGMGSRLGSLTKTIPKAAIEIMSQPLLLRAIKFARKIGVDDIIVIGGYKSECLWGIVKNEEVIRVENPNYIKGSLYTLAAAKKYIDGNFVLMNIDHLYPTHLARMISEIPDGIWAISDFDRPLYQDDMKIKITDDIGRDINITAISKDLDEYDGGYCGMTVVRGEAIKYFKNAFEAVLKHGRDQAVVEDILDELIRISKPPKVLDISGIRWLEIDTQEDLANAERILRMKPHFLD